MASSCSFRPQRNGRSLLTKTIPYGISLTQALASSVSFKWNFQTHSTFIFGDSTLINSVCVPLRLGSCSLCDSLLWRMCLGASSREGTMWRQERKSHPAFVQGLCLCCLPAPNTMQQGALCSLLRRSEL